MTKKQTIIILKKHLEILYNDLSKSKEESSKQYWTGAIRATEQAINMIEKIKEVE